MRLFLDTNSLLGYFVEDADLHSLEELERLLKEKKLVLFSTAQLENEYGRNVANVIDQTRQAIKNTTLQLSYKSIEDENLKKAIGAKADEINKAFDTAQTKRAAEYETRAEKTEKLIEGIFGLGQRVDYSDAIIERAKLRHLKGNPPKKRNDNSYGDAINWESILEHATDDDLVLITRDLDYLEKGAKSEVLNRVLKTEWQSKTKKTITRYPALGKFINTFEKKTVISTATIKKESVLIPTFDYNGSAVVSALSALHSAESAHLAAVSSIAAIMPDPSVFQGVFLPAQNTLKVYAQDIARVSDFFGAGKVFPSGAAPVSGILSARMTDVEPQTIDLRTPEAKKNDDSLPPSSEKKS